MVAYTIANWCALKLINLSFWVTLCGLIYLGTIALFELIDNPGDDTVE